MSQPLSQGGPLAVVGWDGDHEYIHSIHHHHHHNHHHHAPANGLASPPARHHQSQTPTQYHNPPPPLSPLRQPQELQQPSYQQSPPLQQQQQQQGSPSYTHSDPYHNNPYHNNPFHSNPFQQQQQQRDTREQQPVRQTPPLGSAPPPPPTAAVLPGPRHSPPSHPPPAAPQQRLPRQRPRDLVFQSAAAGQSPRSVSSPHGSRTPTAPAPPPSPFALPPAQVSALRFARPPLSPLGAPISTPASPRFTDFDAFAGSPSPRTTSSHYPQQQQQQHRPYRPGALSPTDIQPPEKQQQQQQQQHAHDPIAAEEASYYYSDSSAPPSPEEKVRRQEKPVVLPARTVSRAVSSPHEAVVGKSFTFPSSQRADEASEVRPLEIRPLDVSRQVEVVTRTPDFARPLEVVSPRSLEPLRPVEVSSSSRPLESRQSDSPHPSVTAVESPTPAEPSSTSKTPTPDLAPRPAMAASRAATTPLPPKAPRNSSMDSAVTALASRSQTLPKDAPKDAAAAAAAAEAPPPVDMAHLIRTAGSPEAAIQYLIKERQSNLQQNAQLWRLVNKQRGMIIGLNKDLERALKDKDRYRKKLMEVLAAASTADDAGGGGGRLPRLVTSVGGAGGHHGWLGVSVPNSAVDSPMVDSAALDTNPRPSPIDAALAPLAPYPITPPADHPSGALSPVAELLEGRAEMPKPQGHAYDGFGHDVVVGVAEKEVVISRRGGGGGSGSKARHHHHHDHDTDKHHDDADLEHLHMHDLVSNFPVAPLVSSPRIAPSTSSPDLLPLSPSLLPPQTALPDPPTVAIVEATPKTDSVAQFPSPPQKPQQQSQPQQARKAPPAPLVLAKERRPHDDDDNLVDDENDHRRAVTAVDEPRGRRRTRQEDDQERQIIAQKEAEARSLSKKSTAKKSASQPASPVNNKVAAAAASDKMSPPPRPMPESLASMLSPDRHAGVPAPLRSPGLPSSPRAGFGGPGGAGYVPPPMTPRLMGIAQSGPLPSPRPPRQPILQHPTAPLTPVVLQPPPPPPPPPQPQPQPQTQTPVANVPASAAAATTTTTSSSTNRPPPSRITLPPLAPPPPIITTDTASLSSPKSPSVAKIPPSPSRAGEAATDEPGIFKGFVTDEHPDLLLAPSTLPAVQVKVASSRMKPSRASLMSLTQLEEDPVFTLAVMLRDDPHELWRVEKDSASLLRLDHKMKQCANFTAKTPERSLFSGHAPAKLDARRIALDSYLEQLVMTQLDVYTALELCRYLSTNTLSAVNDEVARFEAAVSGSAAAEGGSSGAAAPSSSSAAAAGGRPVRSGYLTKRGKNFGGWKARFFVLDGPQLQYYETPGGPQLGRIKLQNAQIGKQQSAQGQQSGSSSSEQAAQSAASTTTAAAATPDELDNQYRHAFLIMEPKKKDSTSHVKHILCAESDRERDQWVEALLQWTDYKSSDDDDVAVADARVGTPTGRPLPEKGGGMRRASAADHDRRALAARRRGTKSMHIADVDVGGLIGVSYDSTQAGAAPPHQQQHQQQNQQLQPAAAAQGHRRRASAGIPENSMYATSGSGSHDMGDAASWANKMIGMGLAPAATDDKRHKKRSFFGFGPKVRSSSTDGHDISLFGESGGGGGGNASATTLLAAPSAGGGVRAAFGATLADAVRYCPPTDVDVPLPAVVYRCIQYLDAKRAVFEEGIFRLSGSNVVIRALRERFNTEGDVNLVTDETVYDMHAVASLLKMYLRELPTTILTHDLHNKFVEVSKTPDVRERVAGYAELAQRLPQANATLLKYLVSFLIKIINHQDANKMSVRNVGIVFSPTLNIPNPVFAALLQHYQAIFGIEPEDYELPATATGSDSESLALTAVASAASMPAPMYHHHPGRFESPARPATAGAGASPSRQRLLEAMERGDAAAAATQAHVVIHMHPSRGSPSPPASLASVATSSTRGGGYESQYLTGGTPTTTATGGSFGSSSRPSNDSADGPADYQQQQQQQQQQGVYAPPGVGMGSVGGSTARSRRESAVVMGGAGAVPLGLNPQGSKSRLREETKFL